MKNIKICIIFGILIPMVFIGLSCAANFKGTSQKGVIKGVVLDEDRRPVAEVHINIWQVKGVNLISGVKVQSNSRGEFTIKKFPPNGGRITIDASGFYRYLIDIPWDEGPSYILMVPLIKEDSLLSNSLGQGTIIGKVVDDKPEPIPGTTIALDGTKMGAAANFDGSFKIPNIPPGVYNISAVTVGYAKITYIGIVVNADSTTKVNFCMCSLPIRMQIIRVD